MQNYYSDNCQNNLRKIVLVWNGQDDKNKNKKIILKINK